MLSFEGAFIFLICVSVIHCTRLTIEKNGYKNLLISLPHNIKHEDRPIIVRNIENMMRSSSVLLQMATKGRAYFSEVTILVPHKWKISEDDLAWKSTSFNSTAFSDPRAALTIDEADVVVTTTGQYPYVLHQGGCGEPAMRIILPADFLLRNNDKGIEFLRLWSEYRYGVFPEGGFHNDEKYPHTYHTPDGKEDKTTGCSDKTFWSSSLCNEGDKQCSDTSFTSSVMDQHLSPSATLFCEGAVSLGPRHNTESPSKHNLMCQEEGTWFTVMKSPDFSNGRNAAPKYLQHSTDVAFRFVRESSKPSVIVVIEVSSKMKEQVVVTCMGYSPRANSTKTYVIKHKKKTFILWEIRSRESNDPCLPEVKWCISQKLIPPMVDSSSVNTLKYRISEAVYSPKNLPGALTNRFLDTQASFYQFVYSTLPYGSELTLLVFGGADGAYVAKESTVLKSEDSRILYVESQPLPDESSETGNIFMTNLFDVLFQVIDDSNEIRKASPDIIVVTTESHLNSSTYEDVKQKILGSESRLHVMLFPDNEEQLDSETSRDEVSLRRLCLETGGELISLLADAFGDMNKGFGKSIGSHNKEILIHQDYLKKDDDVDLERAFVVDASLTENLKVFLSFPHSDTDPLDYGKTILQTPSGGILNFMRMDFLLAWLIDMSKPETGEYVLKTSRVKGVTDPVLVTVTGRSLTSDDPITVNVWAETVNGFDKIPQPIRIYAEVKKGSNPVSGASVVASVRHPGGQTSQLALLDDGLGDVDITKDDGVYGRYFTNFTAAGYYNVYAKVTQDRNDTEVLHGPDGFCCGSYFSAVTAHSVDQFCRESGPFSFEVTYMENALQEDRYPPSRVNDLRLNNMFDRICVLHWTAVGDDFDSGFAKSYELTVFRDMTIIRNRFSGSGLEVYSEIIPTPAEAMYGTTLNHAFELPKNLKEGVYYIAVRAIDGAGNVGVPSNIVPVFIEQSSPVIINCQKEEEENCKNGSCEKLPEPAMLQENSARNTISAVIALYIPTNVFIPILSLMLSLAVLNIF